MKSKKIILATIVAMAMVLTFAFAGIVRAETLEKKPLEIVVTQRNSASFKGDPEEALEAKEQEFEESIADLTKTYEIEDYSKYFVNGGSVIKYIAVVGEDNITEKDGKYKLNVVAYDAEVELEKVTEISVIINPAIAGQKVGSEKRHNDEWDYDYEVATPQIASVPSGAHYSVEGGYFIQGFPSVYGEGYDEAFTGEFEEGKEYYYEVEIMPEMGYMFDEDLKVTVTGADDYVTGEYMASLIYVKFTATTETASDDESKVLEGADQIYNKSKSEELTFRFDIPYSDFEADGKVYMDGDLVDQSNYTSKEGSTIITFNSDYANNLSLGDHTLTVAAANNEVSANFTVTNLKNPKTGDSIYFFVGAFIVALCGTIVFIKKK